MRIKSIIAAALLSVIVCTAASAQTPAYREQGYKGSAGFSTYLFFPEIETVHGYMINSKHFVGGGLTLGGVDGTTLLTEHVDYNWYFLDRNNTPMVAAQLGMMQAFYSDGTDNLLFIKASFGWSWTIADRFGLTAGIGISLIGGYPIPSLSLMFEL